MFDTLWLTMPVSTWQRLFDRAKLADRGASDYLRLLIEHGEIYDIRLGQVDPSIRMDTKR